MTVRVCSHRSSMQSDVLNDQQALSNESDCSPPSLPTTLIYSGLKLHPKPLVPTISMPSMATPLSIVKKLSLPDAHSDNSNKTLGSSMRHATMATTSATATPSSIRLVTPTTGKSSPPTSLQFQLVDKSSATNGGFSTSKTFIFNSQQTNSSSNSTSSSLVTLIPPGLTAPKIQTLISSNNDLGSSNDQLNSRTSSFLTKNRLTLVQPLMNHSSLPSSSNSVTPKLVIQPNSTSNIWSSQSTTKILSAKMLSHPVQLISSSEHQSLSSPTTSENSIFTTKTLESGHQAFIHMSLLPSTSSNTESLNTVQLTNFYSAPSSVRISTASRPMDYNNNHPITTPIRREMHIEETQPDSTVTKNSQNNRNALKHRARLPLQPSTQQISAILPLTKKHPLSDDEQTPSSEPPTKVRHLNPIDSTAKGRKVRKSRHRPPLKVSIENKTPSNSSSTLPTSSVAVDPSGIILSKKRSSAELAAAAILSSNHFRKKRVQRKNSDETTFNDHSAQDYLALDDPSIETINDELLRRLSQDFTYFDPRTGIRWIARKTRSQPMNTLLSRLSLKPKINHYEKYSDLIRTNPKRIVPVKSADIMRKKLSQPWALWRIDRLATSLADLTHDEKTTQHDLSDISQSLDQLNIGDHSIRQTIDNLIQDNLQRHRSSSEQLTQISTVLIDLLSHGKTLREICSTSKGTSSPVGPSNSSAMRRTKER